VVLALIALVAVWQGTGSVAQSNRPVAGAATEHDRPLRQGPKRLVPGDAGVGRQVPDLRVTDIHGQAVALSDYSSSAALVIAFTNTTCPISKKYLPSLAALESRFADQNVAFLFVNPTPSDKPEAIRAAIEQNELRGRYVVDETGALVRALAATHTTDAFVLDARRTVIYRGAVDDQYGVAYSLDQPRRNYLIDAVKATLAGERPLVGATEAPGCPLELDEPGEDGTAAEVTNITYHNRISRIVQNHCLECHREGGVGPFSLTTYEELKGQAAAVRGALERNLMPPWFAAPPAAGQVSPFVNDCSLAAPDKADFLAWLNSDKPEGDPMDAPQERQFVDGWQIGQPDLILQVAAPLQVEATGTMPYQWARIESGLTEDKYISAVEVKPTAREVVHHILVFVDDPAEPGRGLRRRGGRGSDGDGEGLGFFAAYAPGYDALQFNQGFGKKVPAGAILRFQIHYTPNGTATEDQPLIGFRFADQPPEKLVDVLPVANHRLAIPPHAGNHEVQASVRLPDDTTVLAFFPHMHLRGKAFRYDAQLPDGTTRELLNVPRYDFNWQLSYRLAELLILPAGTRLTATAWYDNSEGNPANPDPGQTVRWGDQTYEEMMIGYVEYHTTGMSPDPRASSPLANALRNAGSGAGLDALFNRLDANTDGVLSADEIPEDARERVKRLDVDDDGTISKQELDRVKDRLRLRQ
jgi:peroxiredoxin